MERIIEQSRPLKGEITVSADKSISHRAILFSSLSKGESIVRNFLSAADTLSTCRCMQQMGIDINVEQSLVRVKGKGLNGLHEPQSILDCGNSGTTMRLLSGVLASQPFFSVLNGDESLNIRPMQRVIAPLLSMGAEIRARENGRFPPIAITGGKLQGIEYKLPIASAQVKSAILLAGLSASSNTHIIEPEKTRDHSERMLSAMGADITVDGSDIQLHPGKNLIPQEFIVPGDISSAAFFLVAAAIVPGSEIKITNVGVNPSRAGIIEVLHNMGALIKMENQRLIGGEPVADIIVKSSHLRGISLDGNLIPRLIDEIPVLAIAMAMAEGESVVSGARELRLKESDRIKAICSELQKMGVDIEEQVDGFRITGSKPLTGCKIDSHNDHRIAMSLAVAALVAHGETSIINPEVVEISFPDFWDKLSRLIR